MPPGVKAELLLTVVAPARSRDRCRAVEFHNNGDAAVCAAPRGSHWPHVAIEHLKNG